MWIRLSKVEWSWNELNGVEMSWMGLNWVEWELKWVELSWNELNGVEWSWMEFNGVEWSWMELNGVEWSWNELKEVEWSWIELNRYIESAALWWFFMECSVMYWNHSMLCDVCDVELFEIRIFSIEQILIFHLNWINKYKLCDNHDCITEVNLVSAKVPSSPPFSALTTSGTHLPI